MQWFAVFNTLHPHHPNPINSGIIEGSLEVKLPTLWTDGKAEVGRVREEKSRREKIREEKEWEEKEREERRCRCAKSQWFVAPEGRKVGSLKWAGAEPCGQDERWKVARRCGAKHISKSKCTKHTNIGPLLEVVMSKKCTPLWRKAHLEVKSVKKLTVSEHFWKLRCRKSARHCLRDAHFERTPLWARSTFPSQHVKSTTCSDQFWRFRCGFARGSSSCQKWAKREGFVACPKKMAGGGHLQILMQRCVSRGRRSTRDMFTRDVRRSECWFPERSCILEHPIFSFGKVILRDRCSTSYDLASLCRGRGNTLDRWNGKIAKRIGTGAVTLSISEGSLAQLLLFWRCQLENLSKSRRIVSFLTLSSSKIEDVSQNCCVISGFALPSVIHNNQPLL